MTNSNALYYQLFLRTFDPNGLLSDTLQKVIISHLEVQIVNAQGHLLQPDRTCREIYFVVEGIFRSYTRVGEKEITIGFFNQGKFMTDVRSIIAPCASRIGLVADRKGVVLSMKILHWKELCSKYPSCQEINDNIMLMELFQSHRREYRANCCSTEKNIERLMVSFPGILSVVAQKHIATYIGVSGQRMSKALMKINRKSAKLNLS